MPRLEWDGKKAVENYHLQVPYHVLREEPELSCGGEAGAGNLLVEGDNLVALKALLPYYRGQVKCIYIDPPYNTGNEGWVYNDNVSSPIIKDWLGKAVGKEAEDFSRHDKWLCMIYPRLRLLKDFLRPDGIILVSIDDNESANLRLVLDEIFGPQNYIAQLVWEKGRKNDAKLFSVGHEYMFVFARSKAALGETTWRTAKEGIDEIIHEYQKLKIQHRGDWTARSEGMAKFYKSLPKDHPSKKYARAKNVDERGLWRDNNITWPNGGGPKYPVIHPVTKLPCVIPDDGWRFVEETMRQKIAEHWVEFRKDHKKPPFLKSYIYLENETEELEENEGKKEVMGSVFYRHSQPALDVMKSIFGAKVFTNPKDHEVIARIIKYVTSNDKEAVILDSFAGSGTTGHAVMQLNLEDSGNRKFVLVEIDDAISRPITAKRLNRVADGYRQTDGSLVPGTADGFRFLTLGNSVFSGDGSINPEITFSQLARHVWFEATREPLPTAAVFDGPLLGVSRDGTAYYLLFNGILKDRSAAGGNILTRRLLATLPPHDGPKIIYAAGNRLKPERLREERITFRQTPYQIDGAALSTDTLEENTP